MSTVTFSHTYNETMTTLSRIAVAGSSGRMGRVLLQSIINDKDLSLATALVRQNSEWLGHTVGMLIGGDMPLLLTDQLSSLLNTDCLIDFTRPDSTLKHLAFCRTQGINMVIGTTGFTEEEKNQLHSASEEIAIVFSPNMSVGVNVTLKLLELAASQLHEDYDIEVVEMHHRHKIDAPSGTALKMGEVLAQTLGRDLASCAVYGREGITGEREAQTIGFSTMRGGDVVGDHTVVFAGIGERVEISHKASSREAFSQGALRAAKFLADKKSGLYGMADVLFGRE